MRSKGSETKWYMCIQLLDLVCGCVKPVKQGQVRAQK